MLDCWRIGGANSAETFITAVAAILSRYPDGVVYAVTSPTDGLPVELTWMPALKEVRDACEKAMEPIYRREREEKIRAETLAARAEEVERKHRPSTEEMKAKYGENWGLTSLSNIKTMDEKAEENAVAMAREQARVRAEYQHLGLAPPSKFALSPTALRLMAQKDEIA